MRQKKSSAGAESSVEASACVWVDTHCHLDDEAFSTDLAEVIQRAHAAGVRAMICPGTSAASSQAVVKLSENWPGLYAAVGIHPNAAFAASAMDWEQICLLARQPSVVAIGETGLDRYRDFTPWETQLEFLDRHLRLAQELELPVILHCREAEEELLAALDKALDRSPLQGVWHAFSGDLETAYAATELGLYISFAGSATYKNKKFHLLQEAVVCVPDDRLLLETDSPYLVPEPLRGKHQRNEPAHLLLVAQRVAELRDQPIEHLAAVAQANTHRLFKISNTSAK
ncbi:MAG: TatD family hydrolase [Thermoguttaceae bacterium]|nr:TatD family hydrolase [Thermoguttaceae bacterium]MDW8037494.1 TatD family hydrolase [Thermoguttaceae bacterium]